MQANNKRCKKSILKSTLLIISSPTIKNCLNISEAGNQLEKQLGMLDDNGVKGVLKEDREIAEKLNEFFASVLTAEDTGQLHVPELMFSGRESEELRQIAVTKRDPGGIQEITGQLA